MRLALVVLAGCGTSPTLPDAPPPLCTATQPAAPTFANMQLLFDDSCTVCHTHGITLDLSAGVSYANLVGKMPPSYTDPPVDESCGMVLVKPGDPAGSYLYQKVTLAPPCAGGQMPRTDIGTPAPLEACAIGLIHDWVGAGAPPD
jgi:hypothetical protein